MTFGLYVTYDKVGEEYSPVFQQKNDKVCMRVVHEMLKKSPVSPEDFQIIKIGEFDTETGFASFYHSLVCVSCLELFTDEEIESMNIQPSLFSEREVDNE